MRVIAGPEKKSRVMSEKERLVTAYHELGHAIVGHLLPNADPVHKVSIISRGQALGYTISLPTEDKFLTTRAELNDTMAMTLGGRAAEEIVFDEITTGASNDLEKVTETAKQMVMRFGMSERLGPRVFGHDRGQPFLGREFSAEPDYSDEVAREIDDEIRRIVEEAHQTAREILTDNRDELDTISRDPARARDDRGRAVRRPARGQARGGGLPARRGGRRARCPRGRGREVLGALGLAAARAAQAGPRRRRRRRDARRPGPLGRRVLSPWCPPSCGRRRRPRMGPPTAPPPGEAVWSHDEAHGNSQRHPRLLLGRRRVPGSRAGDRPRAGAGGAGRRHRSTSAGSPPGRGPRPSAPPPSWSGSARWSRPWPGTAGRACRSRSTPPSAQSPRRRWTRARRSSTTSPRSAATPRWHRSAPSAVAASC